MLFTTKFYLMTLSGENTLFSELIIFSSIQYPNINNVTLNDIIKPCKRAQCTYHCDGLDDTETPTKNNI